MGIILVLYMYLVNIFIDMNLKIHAIRVGECALKWMLLRLENTYGI